MGDNKKPPTYDIGSPLEGVGTLVAQFSFLQIDKILAELQEMLAKGEDDEALRKYLETRAKDLDPKSHDKLIMLSFGITPQDDFSLSDLEQFTQIDESKYELLLKAPPTELTAGSLVFF
jgi:hypothetical protein